MRILLPAMAGVVALLTTACGADDAKREATAPPTSADTGSPASPAPPTDGDPAFAADDYRYVLTRSCYCPFTVPVTVTVRDGEVTSAVARESAATVSKGDPAPRTHRLTISDIIDIAQDPDMSARVDWPDGQAWPNRVRTDQIDGAVDDEVTYVIERVRVR